MLRAAADAVRSAVRIDAARRGAVTPAEVAELSAALIALRAQLPPVPRWWTDPTAARVEIGARLSALAAGEPRDWIKASMFRALDAAAEDDDDVARDALKHATDDAEDRLTRRWAKEMAGHAPMMRAALFPQDLDDDDDPRAWARRVAAWLEKAPGGSEGIAGREAVALRELLAQEEIPGAPSKLLLVLVYPEDVLARLAWALVVRAEWEKEMPRAAAVALPAAQVMLALRRPRPPRRWTADGRELAELDTEAGVVRLDPFACATFPLDLAARLVAGDLRNLRSKAALGVLNVVQTALADKLRAEPPRPGWRPVLALPTDAPLAAACGLARSHARDCDAALWALSAVHQGDHRGTLQRLLLLPERRRAAPGRTAAWLVVPGLLLMPGDLAADAAGEAEAGRLAKGMRAWRRIMPWPDVPAPDGWARDCDRADAGFAALSLVLCWTEAAGLGHGRHWQDAPGVVVDNRGWTRLVERAHAPSLLTLRSKALDALGDAGWIEVDGDRVAPGRELPRLLGVLDAAAERARDARGKGRKRKRRG